MYRLASVLIVLLGMATAQTTNPKLPARSAPARKAPTQQLTGKKKFAADVVNSAVAIPQPDPQDRLRVLAAASAVIMPLQPQRAKLLSREGLRIEQEIIQRGDVPTASMLESGAVDCPSVQSLVENIPPARVAAAEQTLLGAVSHCSSVVTTVQRLFISALENRIPAPRLALALMDSIGDDSPWSKDMFDKVFSSLPDPKNAEAQAANYSTLFAQMAPHVGADATKSTGLKFLVWLGKIDASPSRNLAVNATTGAMKEVLKNKYDEALASDVIAQQVAQTAGQPGAIDLPEEDNSTVLGTMAGAGGDRSDELNQLPAPQKAREAAANGFVNGTSGNKKLASRYFDIAFGALNDVWDKRGEVGNASAVVQEVSEAAAQVDPVNALQRAQHLDDPTAQAIGMIAIARVVAAEQNTQESAAR